MIKIENIKGIIAITTFGRAGSGLMSSLFDGHKNTLSFPDCYLKSYYRFWEINKKKTKKQIIKSFFYYYGIYFNSDNQANFLELENEGKILNKKLLYLGKTNGFNNLGSKKNEKIKVNKKKFLFYLNKLLKNKQFNRKNFFLAIHLAYTHVYNPKIKKFYKIVFSLHSPSSEDLHKFLLDFPEAKFIQMIRNPVSSFTSAINATLRGGYFTKRVLNYYTYLFTHKFTLVKKNIFYIKIEDLHNNPSKILKKLCNKLGLPFQNSLLTSTFNKKKWFNEKGSKHLSGFSKNFIKIRKNNFSQNDLDKLEIIFAKNIRQFNFNVKRKPLINFIFNFFNFFEFEKKIQEDYNFLDYILYRLRIVKYMLQI